MSLPETHLVENEKLDAEAYIDLFRLLLREGGEINFRKNSPITWQGRDYEGWPIDLEDVVSDATEERARPKLVLWNPEGIFSSFIMDQTLDRATLYRYRVLKSDVEADNNIYQLRTWSVWGPRAVGRGVIEFELREPTDGQNFSLPARRFAPPEFNYVSLG